MPGTFRSTDTAIFVVQYPLRTSTTGSSASLSYTTSYGTANSGFTCVISRPTGSDLSFTMDSPPTGVTWDYIGNSPVGCFRIKLASSVFTTAGIYHASIKVTADASYLAQTDNLQWGGWVDDVASGVDDAKTAAEAAEAAAEVARKCLTNRIEPNNSTAPTSLTLYDDDGTTPLKTRSIANASAAAVSANQILSLGALEDPA